MSKSHALWLSRPCALPLLNLCSRVIWPNKASIRPFQLYYVWNNCLLSPPYGVAVETDEHLTAVGRSCHDNTANPHPLVCARVCWCVYFFSPSGGVTGARHAVISQALWEQGDGTILTPGPTSPSPDKGFSPTRKSFKPVKDQRARSVKTSPEAALSPMLLLSVWSYTGCDGLTGLGFTAGPTLLLEFTHYSYHKFPWNWFIGVFLHLRLNR